MGKDVWRTWVRALLATLVFAGQLALVAAVATPVAAQEAPSGTADLAMASSRVPAGEVGVGDEVAFSFEIQNLGPDRATDAEVFGRVPGPAEGWRLGSVDAPGYSCALVGTEGSFRCDLGDLEPSAAVVTVTAKATPEQPGRWVTASAVAQSAALDPDETNDGAHLSLRPTGDYPSLAVHGWAEPPRVLAGGTTEIRFDVRNDGTVAADDVEVTVPLPVGATVDDATRQSTLATAPCTVGSTEVTCAFGTLEPQGWASVVLTLTVEPAAVAGDVVEVFATVSTTSAGDPSADDDKATASVSVVDVAADLSVDVDGVPEGPMALGVPADLRVTVRNDGPDSADAVSFAASLPLATDGWQVDGLVPSSGACDEPGTWGYVECDLGAIGAGEVVTVDLSVTATSSGRTAWLSFSAEDASSADPDPDDSRRTIQLSTVTSETDLAVSVARASEGPVPTNTPVEYVVTATNLGPASAEAATVRVNLPGEGWDVEGTTPVGPCEPVMAGSLRCDLGPLDPDAQASATVTVTPRVIATTTSINFGVDDPYTEDPDQTNDHTTEQLEVLGYDADLRVELVEQPPSGVTPGMRVSYVYEVSNQGPDDVPDVSVSGRAPAVGNSAESGELATSQGVCDTPAESGDFDCELGGLPAGASARISMAGVAAGAEDWISTWLTVSGVDTSERDWADNHVSRWTYIGEPSLMITGGAAPSRANDGGNARFVFEVWNAGPVVVEDAVLSLTLPDGVSFAGARVDDLAVSCDVASSDLRCSMGPISTWDDGGSGESSQTIELELQLDGSHAIGSHIEFDVTATPFTGGSSYQAATMPVSVQVVDAVATLDWAYYSSRWGDVTPGGRLEWYAGVWATDANATDVVMTDVLPPGVTLEGYEITRDPSSWGETSCEITDVATNQLTCRFGTLAADSGADVTLFLRTDPGAHQVGDVISSQATFVAANAESVATDLVTVEVVPEEGHLAVWGYLAYGSTPVETGDEPDIDVTVHNGGPADATDVTLTAALPPGFGFVGATRTEDEAPLSCSFDAGAVSCSLGSVDRDEYASVRMTLAAPDEPSPAQQVVVGISGSQPDPVPDDNTAVIEFDVASHEADLGVSITAPEISHVDDVVRWSVGLTNDGPGRADDVVLEVVLPEGVSTPTAGSVWATFGEPGSCEVTGRVVTCGFDVAGVEYGWMQLSATVEQTGVHVASASVTASSPEPADASLPNEASASTTVSEAELAVRIVEVEDQVELGAPYVYRAEVSNLGGQYANDVSLVADLPAGTLQYIRPVTDSTSAALDPSGFSCEVGGTQLACALASMRGRTKRTVEVSVIPDAVGPIEVGVTASFADVVEDPIEDNHASESAEVIESVGPASIRREAGFVANTLPGHSVSTTTDLPFTIDWFGEEISRVVVHRDGHIRIGTGDAAIDGHRISTKTNAEDEHKVQYGEALVDGRPAFAVTWGYVRQARCSGFCSYTPDKSSFQIVIVDRSDLGAGLYDIELNYGHLRGGHGLAGIVPGGGAPQFRLPGSGTAETSDTSSSGGLIAGTANADGQLGRYRYRLGLTSDLAVEATVPDTVAAGDLLETAFSVSNTGPDRGSGTLVVPDPEGTTYQSATSDDADCGRRAGRLECSLELSSGDARVIRVTHRVLSERRIPVNVTGRIQSLGLDPVPSNDESTGVAHVEAHADLRFVGASGSVDPLILGDEDSQTTHRYNVRNEGPSTALEPDVAITIPSGLELVQASEECGPLETGVLRCTLAPLAPTASDSVALVLRGAAVGTHTTRATVTAAESDPQSADNTASITTSVVAEEVDLEARATNDQSQDVLVVGETARFDLRAHNHGPATAEATTLTAEFPAEVRLLGIVEEDVPGACAIDGSVVSCEFGSIEARTAARVVVEAEAITAGPTDAGGEPLSVHALVQVASANAEVPRELYSNVEEHHFFVVPPAVDLQPTAQTTWHGHVGVAQRYWVGAFNGGIAEATDVQIEAILPAELRIDQLPDPGEGISCDPVDGRRIRCTVDRVARHSSVSVAVDVTPIAVNGAATASVTVSSPSPDADPSNDTKTFSSKLSTRPTASLRMSPSAGVYPLEVTATVEAHDAEGDALYYQLHWGDGHVDGGLLPVTTPPTHTYERDGLFRPYVVVSDGGTSDARAVAAVDVDQPSPLRADAGPDVSTTENDPEGVTLDGSGSSPAPSIRAYRWRVTGPGIDRTYSGSVISEIVLPEGTYEATLTVEDAEESATDTATITVEAPAPALTVEVRALSGGAALPGADIVVIDADGARHSAKTDDAGRAPLFGLANGEHAIYVVKKGFVPTKALGTVTGGADVVEVELTSGDVATATLEARRLTAEEAIAAGIDPNDPDNNHVVQFDIHLAFERFGTPVPFRGILTRKGFWNASVGGQPCTSICTWSWGGYGGGGTVVISSSFVGDHPQILYMVIPVKARWLKEFYDVSLTVQNLAPEGFTLAGGAARLMIPGTESGPAFGLPALFGQPQTNPQEVPDIPGGESRTIHWIARGDVGGLYHLAAEYAAVLDPLDLPVNLLAETAEPIKVWGVDAVRPRVVAEDRATYRSPYRLSIELCNVTDSEPAYATPVYNLSFELLEEGTEHQIYQGGQQLDFGPYSQIDPGKCTPPSDLRVFPDFSGVLRTALSFVEMKGAGEVSRGGDFLTSIPASEGGPRLMGRPVVKGIQLAWDPVPGDDLGYEVWRTVKSAEPEPLTEWEHFPRTPAMTVPPGQHTAFVPGQAGDEFEYSVRPIGQHTVHPLATATVVNFPPMWHMDTPPDGKRFDVRPGQRERFRVGATDPEGTPVTITWKVHKGDGTFGDESLDALSCTPEGDWLDCTIEPTANEQKVVRVLFSAKDSDGGSALGRTILIDTSDFYTYLALGDSFSAGEGVDPYFRDYKLMETGEERDNRCHRSSRGYPTLVQPPGLDAPLYVKASRGTGDSPVPPGTHGGTNKYGSDRNVRQADGARWVFWACSGAETPNIWDEPQPTEGEEYRDPHVQLAGKGIDHTTDLVTISIGGNDAQFGPVVATCLAKACFPDGRESPLYKNLVLIIDNLEFQARRVIKEVRRATSAGRILFVGYPHLFPEHPDEQDCPSLTAWRGEMDLLRELTNRANDLLKKTAEANGATFVDVRKSFAEHEPCGRQGAWINDWNSTLYSWNDPGPITDDESFHPKRVGQEAYAAAVNWALGTGTSEPANERSVMQQFGTALQYINMLSPGAGGTATQLFVQTVWPGSDIVTTLVSPSGRRIDRDTFAEDVVHIVGPTYERYEVTDPEPGIWTVEHFGADVDPEGEPYEVDMWAEDAEGSVVPLEAPLPPRAVARASAVEGRAPLPVEFDGSGSSDVDGEIVSYEWDFGDGTTASGPTVSHTFSGRGRYTVTLTVTDDTGMTATDLVPLGAVTPTTMELRGAEAAPVGSTMNYEATVSPVGESGTPTGLVTFRRDGIVIEGCSSQVVDEVTGTARCETIQPAGTEVPMTISAVYSGDERFGQSTDSLEQDVVATASRTTVTSSANPADAGSEVTLTAAVESLGSAAPTGTVDFLVDGTPIASCTGISLDVTARATCTTRFPEGGSIRQVEARYGGDGQVGPSSGVLEQQITCASCPPGGGGGTPGGGTPGGGGGGGGSSPGGGGGSSPGDSVSEEPVAPGGTVSTSDGVVDEDDPVDVSVTSPVGGTVSIIETTRTPGQRSGYRIFGQAVVVEAPASTPTEPLQLTFELDASLRNGNQPIRVFRNGKRVASCQTTDGTANPDPCVVATTVDGDVIEITVLTSHASEWTFGQPSTPSVSRTAGGDRIETAVALSKSAFDRSETVVLARADDHADSLAGGPLAASLRAPVLLTASDRLPAVVGAEIARLGARRVVVLGGTNAIGPAIDSELRRGGVSVERVAGSDRFDTAARVSAELPSDVAYLVRGSGVGGWADALSVAAVAARFGRPILLSGLDRVTERTRRALTRGSITRVVVVGGTSAVSGAVETELRSMGITTTRLAGDDRYATSTLVANHGLSLGMEVSFLWAASGGTFADALAGGPIASWRGGALLLVPATGLLPAPTSAWLERHASGVEELTLIGGSAAIAGTVEEQLRSVLMSSGTG